MVSKRNRTIHSNGNRLWIMDPPWFPEVCVVRTFPRKAEVLKKERNWRLVNVQTYSQGGIHRYITAVLTEHSKQIDQQQPAQHRSDHTLVAFGSLGPWGFGEEREGEGENNSAGSVRPPVYGLGWGWGLSQYGKMPWSLFLLVNSLSNGWLLHND